MLILDDVSVTRGASFGTVLDRTLTRSQADQVVDTLAALHRRSWNAPLHRPFGSWLEPAYEHVANLDGFRRPPSR